MKKKLIYLTLTIGICFNLAFSFFSKNDETSKLYLQCLKIYIQKLDGPIKTPDSINIINNDVALDLPNYLGNYKLKIVNDSILNKLTNKNISINAIQLFPIRIENGELVIIIGDVNISKDKDGLHFAYAGEFLFYFRYNCQSKRYKLVSFKNRSL